MRRALLVAGVIAVGLVLVVAAATLAREQATRVTGRLAGIRELSFVEGTQPDGGVSPVCGCKEPPLDAWRGITFAARGVRLDRRGGLPWTRWIVSAAEPDAVAPMGELQRLQAVAVRFRPRGRFDPHWLLSGDLARHGRVLEKSSFSGAAFSLFNRHDLRLAMLSSVPLAAWVPYPESKVDLVSQRSEFFAEDLNSRIVEQYPQNIAVHHRRGHHGLWVSRPQVFPLGDFLGPNLVLWTEDPTARIFGTALDHRTQPGVITAVLIGDTNFSTRIAVAPVKLADIAETAVHADEDPVAGREELFLSDVPGGKVTLTVEKALDQRQYQALKKRVRAHPITWVPIAAPGQKLNLGRGRFGSSSTAHLPGTGREEERYPPLPRYSGLNIFGPLDQVAFKGVHGSLMIADKEVGLGGSADLVLGQVHGLHDQSGHELISAPLSTSRQSADLQFDAVGTASVNGVSKTTVKSHLEPRLAIAGTVITLAGSLFGLLAALRRLGRRRRGWDEGEELEAAP